MEDNQMLELASLLVNYVRMHPAKANDDEERERGFRSLAGCWANDQGDDDMEAIIRQGRESRRGNRIVPSFDEYRHQHMHRVFQAPQRSTRENEQHQP